MESSSRPSSDYASRPLWLRGLVRLRRFHEWLVRPPVGLDSRYADFYPLSNYVHGMGLLAHVSFLLLFWWLGLGQLVAFNVLSVAVFVLTFQLSRHGRLDPALLIGGVEVAAHQGLAVWMMGLGAGFQHYVLVLVMGTLFYSHIRLPVRVLMAVAPAGWYLLLLVWGQYMAARVQLDQHSLTILSVLNALLFVCILMGMAMYFQFAVARARDKAERMAASKTLFLANMSHELRTPLNAILGFAQILARSDQIPVSQRSKLQGINRSGEHLLTLINRILDMSKLEAGKLELRAAPFELQQMLTDVEAMFAASAQAKGLRLDFRQTTGLPELVEGDVLRLRQVLINLVGNSLKFTREGQVAVETALARRQPPAGVRLRFTVRDTGIGISRAEQHDLFEVFTQTESGRRSGQGTGLGLALCRRIVELMGGEIGVRSKPGFGSRFWFEVNLDEPSQELPPQPAPPPVPGAEIAVLELVKPQEPLEAALQSLAAWSQPKLQALEQAAATGDFDACARLLAPGGEEICLAPIHPWLPELLEQYRFDRLQELAQQALQARTGRM